MTCTQNFTVISRSGNPIVGNGWIVHAEILYIEDDSLIIEKTCKINMSGSCSIEISDELLTGTWLHAYATKGSETTLSEGTQPPCMYDTLELWQKVKCNQPTPNHASGHELLLYWDKDKDGVINEDDVHNAILAYLGYNGEEISINEFWFIIKCYNDYGGVIDNMCPPSPPTSYNFYIILIAIAIIALLLIFRK